jgi:hypothetical protein
MLNKHNKLINSSDTPTRTHSDKTIPNFDDITDH